MCAAVLTRNQPRDQEMVQLGFPSNFSTWYAEHGGKPQWFNDVPIHGERAWVSEEPTLQDNYHEQKRLDADRMALAGVAATKASKAHLLLYPHNYNVPKPVLGQRIFANPSNGNTVDLYSSRPSPFVGAGADFDFDSHLSGGVLRTAKGQLWAQRQLAARVQQLNDIDNEVVGFTQYEAPAFAPEGTEEKATAVGLDEASGIKLHLELSSLLSAFAAAIQSGEYNRFALGDLFKFLQILFRVGATSTASELNDLLAVVEELMEDVRGAVVANADLRPAPGPGYVANLGNNEVAFLTTIQTVMAKAREYLIRMITSVNKSPKERKAASRNAVKNLQFTRAVTRRNAVNVVMPRGRRREPAELEPIRRLENQVVVRGLRDRIRGRREEDAQAAQAAQEAEERRGREMLRQRALAIRQRAGLPVGVGPARGLDIGPQAARVANINRVGLRGLQANLLRRRLAGLGKPPATAPAHDRITHVREPPPPSTAKLDKDYRATWAARQGAYYGESLPEPEGFVPPRQPYRKMKPNDLQRRLMSPEPTFSG